MTDEITVGAFRRDGEQSAPPVMSPAQTLYWAVRREVWENRSIYIAPLVVACVALFASLATTLRLPKKLRAIEALGPVERHDAIIGTYGFAPAMIMMTTLLVGVFYALDSLYGERRDRSILFWKSLPVSDRMTVIAKAMIPLVVLPAVAILLCFATRMIQLIGSTGWVIANGMSPAVIWREWRFFQSPIVMIYGLGVHILWAAPIYAWLMLLSAWAKRAPFLWAFLPVIVIQMIERMAFGTKHIAKYLSWRWNGPMTLAFDLKRVSVTRHDVPVIDQLSQLTPINFFTTPGLWGGLLAAGVFLALAIHLRRNREPI